VFRNGRYYRPIPKPRDSQEITIQTPKGPEKLSGLEYRLRVMEARDWVSKEHHRMTGGKDMGSGPSPELYKRAQQRFGLNEGWQRDNNQILNTLESDK
jgi:hypothetical protein